MSKTSKSMVYSNTDLLKSNKQQLQNKDETKSFIFGDVQQINMNPLDYVNVSPMLNIIYVKIIKNMIINDNRNVLSSYNNVFHNSNIYTYLVNVDYKILSFYNIVKNRVYSYDTKEQCMEYYIKSCNYYNILNRFARICILKYRKKYDYEYDMCMENKLDDYKKEDIMFIIDNKRVYKFYSKDLYKITKKNLTMQDDWFSTPKMICNPFTNNPFTISQLYNIYFFLESRPFRSSDVYKEYFRNNFNIKYFQEFTLPTIREDIIKEKVKNMSNYEILNYSKRIFKKYCLDIGIYHKLNTTFPVQLLRKHFKYYIELYLLSCYSTCQSKRFYYSRILKLKLKIFFKDNPTFGRKIVKKVHTLQRDTSGNIKNINNRITLFQKKILPNKFYHTDNFNGNDKIKKTIFDITNYISKNKYNNFNIIDNEENVDDNNILPRTFGNNDSYDFEVDVNEVTRTNLTFTTNSSISYNIDRQGTLTSNISIPETTQNNTQVSQDSEESEDDEESFIIYNSEEDNDFEEDSDDENDDDNDDTDNNDNDNTNTNDNINNTDNNNIIEPYNVPSLDFRYVPSYESNNIQPTYIASPMYYYNQNSSNLINTFDLNTTNLISNEVITYTIDRINHYNNIGNTNTDNHTPIVTIPSTVNTTNNNNENEERDISNNVINPLNPLNFL